MDQPGTTVGCQFCSWPAEQGKFNSPSPFAPDKLISRDGFDRPVPRQPAHLHTQAESGIKSERNPPLYCCTLTLIAIQGHQNRDKRHDEPGYSSILLHWVWDRMGVSTTGIRTRLLHQYSLCESKGEKAHDHRSS